MIIKKRIAIVKITKELVSQILNNGLGSPHYYAVPNHNLRDIKIEGVADGASCSPFEPAEPDLILIKISSPDLPEIEQGTLLPTVDLQFRKIYVEKAKV